MKMKKIIGIAGLSLLGIIVLFVVTIVLGFTSFMKREISSTANIDWMKRISDDKKVSEIIIPGSHDAGSAKMAWLGETQHLDIKQQLKIGVRYFDVRVKKKKDKLIIFHGPINGQDFLPILADVKNFIINNPTETILLDFQHFDGDSQKDVFNEIKKELYEDNLVVENNTEMSDLEFLDQLKLTDARGKCIVFWGDSTTRYEKWLFLRNDDECTKKGVGLNSYYYEMNHKGSIDDLLGSAHKSYFGNIEEKIEQEGNKGIFILQCQLTDGNKILGPYHRERANGKKISEYIKNLKNSPDYKYLNVIMRDYLTEEKTTDIINLNF